MSEAWTTSIPPARIAVLIQAHKYGDLLAEQNSDHMSFSDLLRLQRKANICPLAVLEIIAKAPVYMSVRMTSNEETPSGVLMPFTQIFKKGSFPQMKSKKRTVCPAV